MNISATFFPPTVNPARWLTTRLALASACAALADWLFFGRAYGLSLALFLGVVGLIALATNPSRADRRMRLSALALFASSLLALIEDVSPLSLGLGLMGTALFAVMMTSREIEPWRARIRQAGWMLACGPFRLVGDALRVMRLARRPRNALSVIAAPLAWIMPALLLGVFLYLFASANPLIDSWLAAIDLRSLFDLLAGGRPLFWLTIICAVWPAIHVRAARARRARIEAAPTKTAAAARPDDLFGATAFLRSLVMLNALFALQTSLDLAYLWGGLALPGGMSYAEYAHRGAYPLIATALLAGILVLFAMRPGGPAESSRLIRPLVLVFVGQDIALVVSSLLRLNLYVAAYGLTELRVAAFVWFLLVALGLGFIVAQVLLNKPLSWLVKMNASALATALYVCCFLNFPLIIANYNIDHRKEATASGPHLDLCYLLSLGPQVIPAIDRIGWPEHAYFLPTRDTLAKETRNTLADWRGWGFRAWRLQQYLANNAETPRTTQGRGCILEDF